jgi:hypothetical protein
MITARPAKLYCNSDTGVFFRFPPKEKIELYCNSDMGVFFRFPPKEKSSSTIKRFSLLIELY